MNKKKLALASIIGITALTFGAVVLGTVSWFQTTIAIPKVNIDGNSAGAYFAYGNGKPVDELDPNSKDRPYGITHPRHLYNLAWLQYMGFFSDDQYYFELANDIDMTGWTLPPIGTEDNPFVGNFNGNGNTITGLIVSNDEDELFAVDNKHPNLNSYNAPEIVGFFGVVGNLDGAYTGTYDSSITSLSNVTLDDLTVTSTTAQTLIGLAAGYVDGEMSDVSITGNATIDVNGQASTALTDITNNLTDYGLVGYSTSFGGSPNYTQKLSEYYKNTEYTGGGGGQDTKWGGSINMLELNKRIYYLLNKNTERKTLTNIEYNAAKLSYSRYHRYYADNTNNKKTTAITLYEAAQGTTSRSWYNTDPTNPPSDRYPLVYRFEGKRDDARDGASGTGSIKLPGTFLPLLTDTQENDYAVLAKNTGYIASAGFYGSGTSVRTAAYKNIMVGNSVSPYSTTEGTSYNVNKIEVLSNSAVNYAAGNYARIDNEITSEGAAIQTNYTASISSTSFYGYKSAYSKLKTVLGESNYVQGLHFTGNTINKSNIIEVPNAYINGEEITDYPVLTSSVDFNLKESGSIKLFAGTYYNSVGTNADSFFSLHAVNRSGKTISNTYQIYDIYANTNVNTKDTYPYLYYDSNGSLIEIGYTSGNITKGSKLFDMRFLHNAPPMANAIYYFEIPVNAGEFALGSVAADKTKGAYLLYLDIGTNGQSVNTDTVTAYSITTIRSSSYPEGVDFAPVAVSGNGGDSIGVFIESGKQGTIIFAVSDNVINVTDTLSIAGYSFQGTKYSSTDPPNDKFEVTGNSPGAMATDTTAGGTRVIYAHLKPKTGNVEYDIRITDLLAANGTYQEAQSVYELNSGSGYATSSKASIEALSNEIKLADIRGITIAATLTRDGISNKEFTTTYNTARCSCANKIIDVTITTNSTKIKIGVTAGYVFKIDNVVYNDGSTYPAS